MKRLKVFGLAAVAAMALTAFLGASSASATVLCTTTPAAGTACGTGWHVDELVASLTGSFFVRTTSGSVQYTCTVGSWTATKTATGSATTTPVDTVAKANMTWGPVGESCTTTLDTVAGGTLEVHWIGGTDNGTVTATGFEWTTVVAGVTCVFGLEGTQSVGDLTGGAPAVMHVGVVVVKKSGSFVCPPTQVLEGTFQVTNHTAVYVVEK